MKPIDQLRALGLFNARVPRYTSYPTAAVFSPDVGARFQKAELAVLDPATPVSVYIHIPFCERLCWFCACHTQGTRTLSPVESYVGVLEAELALLAATLPQGVTMGRLHWGGGTPTILSPDLIHRLAVAIRRVFTPAEEFEFSVEIDPTMVDAAKIAALAEEGMTRASIGIQDFDPLVQTAIGRDQPFEVTRACVDNLRATGLASLNLDLVYGLPHQTIARLDETIDRALTFDPDRIALFGYAHVPWVSKRQKLIDEASLPGDADRYHLATRAAERFRSAGLSAIGIDHFAKPGDELGIARDEGRLRRNFQGYTADTCQTLIGLGASAISRLPGGYVQNAPATAAFNKLIGQGDFAGARGWRMTRGDHLRARAIEMIMCDFRLDLVTLSDSFGAEALALAPHLEQIAAGFQPFAAFDGRAFTIHPDGRPLARIMASGLDEYMPDGVRYSRAS